MAANLPGPAASRQVPDDDLFVLLLVGAVALAGAAGAAAATWDATVGWLVAHQVLVPAAADPLLALPGGGGGLDLPRVSIAAAALLLLLAAGAAAVRRRLQGGQ